MNGEVGGPEVVEGVVVDVPGGDSEVPEGVAAQSRRAARPRRPQRSTPWSRLYRGETAFEFIGRTKWWFALSAAVIVAGGIGLGVRGLNLSIDFKGGVSWQVTAKNASVSEAQKVVEKAGLSNPTVTVLGGKTISVDAKVTGTEAHRNHVENTVAAALAKLARTKASNVSVSFIGPSWGGNISSKAIEALVIFFLAIAAYISLRFEWRMAVAAIVAVVHDLAVAVGVYALSGFQVTPDTVIAVLTILGYSLYDTVVVFDRVNDNVKGIGATGRITYSDTVNLSMNQVLMRSINTSLVAILPILSVLVLGAYILGATTLENFGLALFIGLASGAYSSIFIASPLLAILKERESRYATIRRRLAARGGDHQLVSPAEMARSAAASQAKARPGASGGKAAAGVIVPGSAHQAGRAGAPRSGGAGTAAASGTGPEGPGGADTMDGALSTIGASSPGSSKDGPDESAIRPPRPRSKKRRR